VDPNVPHGRLHGHAVGAARPAAILLANDQPPLWRRLLVPGEPAPPLPAVFDVQGRADLHGECNLRLDRPGLLPYRGPSPTLEATMGMRSGGLSAVLVLLVASACGGGRRSVLLPPRLDLQPYGRLGLGTFTVEHAT